MCCYRLKRWKTKAFNKLFINNQTICSSFQGRYQSLQYERIHEGDFSICFSFFHNAVVFPDESSGTLGD